MDMSYNLSEDEVVEFLRFVRQVDDAPVLHHHTDMVHTDVHGKQGPDTHTHTVILV